VEEGKAITIEICSSNAFLDDIATVDWLSKTYPEVSIEPADCLDRCGICIKYAYVLANDHFLYGNTVSEVKDMIVSYIEKYRAGRVDAEKMLNSDQEQA
jgi:uncharacterized protein YuzB (UPF0349 family)